MPCTCRTVGRLGGYKRAFNKKSVKRWGTKELPGPTLNLVAEAKASCRGALFEFPDDSRDEVMSMLGAREGKNFTFPTQKVRLGICRTIYAVVPIYSGKNIIQNDTTEHIIDMICAARGDQGSCRDYVINLSEHMQNAGIVDAIVAATAQMVRTRDTQQPPPRDK